MNIKERVAIGMYTRPIGNAERMTDNYHVGAFLYRIGWAYHVGAFLYMIGWAFKGKNLVLSLQEKHTPEVIDGSIQ